MIRIRFFDLTSGTTRFEALAQTASLHFAVSETPTFSATVTLSQINLEYLRDNRVGIEMYYRGQLLIGGVCQDMPDPNKPTLNIKGRQWIDLLYEDKAWSQAVYTDQYFLLVLGELLRRAGWRIGYIDTMVDKAQKTSIDLRQSEKLLTQITKLVEETPKVYYRYGGFIAGKHALDIGVFGAKSGVQLHRMDDAKEATGKTGSIESIQESFQNTDILRDVEAFGGDTQISAAVTRAINLGDALAATPALATDPDFPILTEVANFVWYVRNNAIAANQGSSILKRYPQYAPERTGSNATNPQIQGAGLALYQRVKALLQDRSANVLDLDIDAKGDLGLLVDPGDTVFVRAARSISSFDTYSGVTSQQNRKVEGDFRCNSIDISLSGDEISFSYKLTNGTLKKEEDEFVSVYDTQEKEPPTGAVFAPVFPPQFATRTLSVPAGTAANTTMSDGSPGVLATITNHGGAAPVGATGVYLAGIPFGTSPDGTLTIELVSDPIFADTGTVVRINVNGAWGLSYSASLEARIVWI